MELKACQRIAAELNTVEGTDYYAENAPHDPPDCLMKSRSQKLETREVEVTSAAADFILRADSDNLVKACKALETQLEKSGIRGWLIQLDLTDNGLRYGLKEDDVSDLASVFCAEPRGEEIGGTRLWQLCPKLAELVGGIAGYRTSANATHVVPSLATWESDGSCIGSAILAKSRKKYASRYDLVVDCAWYIGKNEVQSFEHANSAQSFPFRTIWLTTEFDGVFKVK